MLGEAGTGCSNDLLNATATLRALLFGQGAHTLVFLPNQPIFPSDLSLLESGMTSLYNDALRMVTHRKQRVLRLANRLQRDRYLDGSELLAVFAEMRGAFHRTCEDGYEARDRYWKTIMDRDPRPMAA